MRASLIKLAILLAVWLAIGQCASVTWILSGSMAPTLLSTRGSRDLLLIDQLTPGWREIRRGDIVCLPLNLPGRSAPETVGKRVVALPGETVELRDGRVLVDGRVLRDPPIFEEIRYAPDGYFEPGVAMTIASEAFFILGDHTADSYDGRYFGGVPREELTGRIALILWPPRRLGRPRGT